MVENKDNRSRVTWVLRSLERLQEITDEMWRSVQSFLNLGKGCYLLVSFSESELSNKADSRERTLSWNMNSFHICHRVSGSPSSAQLDLLICTWLECRCADAGKTDLIRGGKLVPHNLKTPGPNDNTRTSRIPYT